MDYNNLLNSLDMYKLENVEIVENVEIEEIVEIKNCCNEKKIVLTNHIYVCCNCGIVDKTEYEIETEDFKNPHQRPDVFFPNKSMNSWVGYVNSNSKYKTIKRINKWMNYSSKDNEANKCYNIIEKMIKLIFPNLQQNHNIGEKILYQSKLLWKALYYSKLVKSTRGEPRKCLFAFCIIKSLENYKIDFILLDTLNILLLKNTKKNTNIITKYNKVLTFKIQGEEKTFINRHISKYLEIINRYDTTITLDILTEKYNINIKNKINKNKLEKKNRININPSSIIKAISYDYIKTHITKHEACDILLNISSLTLNKALKIII